MADSDLVYHVLNPRLFSWKRDLLPALQRSELPAFDVVSTAEWLRRLEASSSEQDVEKNPSLKLVGFWRKKYGKIAQDDLAIAQEEQNDEDDDDGDVPGLHFETATTERDSPSIASAVDPVSEGLIERYVATWMKKWKI